MGERTPARRACDRCYKVKERCRWMQGPAACERCLRLGSPCQSLRPIVPAGRKPRHQRAKAVVGHNTPSPCSKGSPSALLSESAHTGTMILGGRDPAILHIPNMFSVFIDLDERELQLLCGVPRGQTRIDQFLIGPSFRVGHQKTFLRHLCIATPLIQDALIASSALISCESELHPLHQDRLIGHKRAASAISALRSLKSFDSRDLSTVLMLAANAVTFALHISGSALEICRHSLHLIKPFYESNVEMDSDSLAFLVCLIYSETVECLLQCEIPTIRFRVKEPQCHVDRFLGITSPMLPHLYHICELSYALRHDISANRPRIMESLSATEMAADQWDPTLPDDFISRFSQGEIFSMLAQANVYRLSILLIALRLRYPYGTETSKGTAMSDAILDQLDQTIRLTKRSVPCVSLAFIAACFELTDPMARQTALDKTKVVIEFSRQVQIETITLLTTFWSIRDSQGQMYWFDLPSLFSQQQIIRQGTCDV